MQPSDTSRHSVRSALSTGVPLDSKSVNECQSYPHVCACTFFIAYCIRNDLDAQFIILLSFLIFHLFFCLQSTFHINRVFFSFGMISDIQNKLKIKNFDMKQLLQFSQLLVPSLTNRPSFFAKR